MKNFKETLEKNQEELLKRFETAIKEMDLDTFVQIDNISFRQKDGKKCKLVRKELFVDGKKVIQLVEECEED